MIRLVLIGGGNIGSHLTELLARMSGVSHLTIIDRDIYEIGNLTCQAFGARDVGRTKASVQALRARSANPALRVTAIHAPVENIPLGSLHGDVILTGLDSRRARQYVNEASRRLGVPWIDAGVMADDLLVRVTTCANTANSPCRECAWSDDDYAALEQAYPCTGKSAAVPTGAPASLGALAASLQATECAHVLARTARGETLESREFIFDATHYARVLTTLRLNTACRLSEHRPWRLELVNDTLLDCPLSRLGDSVEPRRYKAFTSMEVAGARFQVAERCPQCAAVRTHIRVIRQQQDGGRQCARCGTDMHVTGLDVVDSLRLDTNARVIGRRTPRQLGVRPLDVITLGDGTHECHLGIGFSHALRS